MLTIKTKVEAFLSNQNIRLGEVTRMNPLPTKSLKNQTSASIACLTDTGHVGKSNKDAFIVMDLTEAESIGSSGEFITRPIGEQGLLLAVADGIGGTPAGGIASRMATEQLARKLVAAPEKKPVSEWLRKGIKATNHAIRNASQANSEYQGMGATITAAIITEGQVVVGQVGDSRAYLIREGQINQVTKDQSLVQMTLDAGQITDEKATHFRFRNVIVHALGAEDEVEPAISSVRLARADHLLLCSDGLSNKVGNVEMYELVLSSESLSDACEWLVGLANGRGGEDNITLIVACFDGKELPAVKKVAVVDTPRLELMGRSRVRKKIAGPGNVD
jgi:PPM family protein phosphatase